MILLSRRLFTVSAVASIGVLGLPAAAATSQISVNRAGVAIQGYDSHAYFQIGSPRNGLADHVVNWNGVPWHFASAADAAAFEAAPQDFAPQFGGFCTRAMSFRKVVDGDPEVWRIHKGKLYLFARPIGGTKFDEGQDAMIAKAQAYWDTLD